MDWHIAPHTRLDLVAFTGINFSGETKVVSIHPAGGRQGASLDGFTFRSVLVVGPIGTRVTFRTSVLETGWEERPWRVVQILKGHAFRTKTGKPAVRVPDLDWYDKPLAQRTDPDFQQGFPMAKDLASGEGWTFGKPGSIGGQVSAIGVDRVR